MLHLLILILRLFCQHWDIGGDIPALDHKVTAARDQHVVFTVVDVDHVQNYVFVLCNHKVFLHHFF
jgi:hypothetical protein